MIERVEPQRGRCCTRAARRPTSCSPSLQAEAKAEGLWALGHPAELGGGGLPFLDYVYVNEVQGRSEYGQLALGTWTLQDSIMLQPAREPAVAGAPTSRRWSPARSRRASR